MLKIKTYKPLSETGVPVQCIVHDRSAGQILSPRDGASVLRRYGWEAEAEGEGVEACCEIYAKTEKQADTWIAHGELELGDTDYLIEIPSP